MNKEEKNELSLENALEEIEKINEKLEKGGLSLEEMLAEYKRGTDLVEYCNKLIEKTEKQIQLLAGGERQEFGNEQ